MQGGLSTSLTKLSKNMCVAPKMYDRHVFVYAVFRGQYILDSNAYRNIIIW